MLGDLLWHFYWGYCTNWIIAITTVTFRRYGRVPLKTGARSFTCYHIYHLTLFILDTVLANSADPDEMPHKAAFHLVLHCLQRKKIQTSWLSKLKKYKSRITLSVCLSAHPSPCPSWHRYYARAPHCMCAYTFVYGVRVYFNMKITECFLILMFYVCTLTCTWQTDARVPACSLTFYHTVKTQMKHWSVLFA